MPSLLTHLFFWRIERRLTLKINKKPLLVFSLGSIRLNEADIEFNRFLKVKAGSIQIDYPFFVFLQSTFELKIKGQNLLVIPDEELRKVLGQNDVLFEQVSAKLLILPDRKISFEYLDAQSKTLQFHLGVKKS